MRKTQTISLPAELVKYIKREVKAGGYMSTSEYIRALVRDRQDTQLLDQIKKSEEDIKHGRIIRGKTLKDFM